MENQNTSPRSRLACLLFCVFLGVLGAHRFYVGKIGTAVLMLCTLGGLGVWVVVDAIFIVTGIFRDSQGLRVMRWMEH
ncbi:MAG: TM2 domain-containing protein [Candidatus Omnitrophica bacterium]|nr:TM2 domain-containing protein [Candidatus Omnitrophota bacterium]